MVILGIDPGTANTGFGVVEKQGNRLLARDGGVIRTSAKTPVAERLAEIHSSVLTLIERHEPAALAIEDLYFGQNVSSAFAVGQARGVVVLAAGQTCTDLSSYTPQQIKGAVCGNGAADKLQVQTMVQHLLGLPELPRPDHAADALAVAICHANRAPYEQAVAAA